MPCYYPLPGYRARAVGASGKRGIVFNKKDGFVDRPVSVPCGQCNGCRLERSRQWAIRCSHEAQLWEDNCFITLTYADAFLPPGGNLDLPEFQKFMKRLRHRFGPGVRFFHCGEYGEKYLRPHYHACLFNCDFPDRLLWKISKSGERLYRSEILEELWPYGHSSVGDVTFQSAAYVARYITKKQTGPTAYNYYSRYDEKSGQIWTVRPEYVTMSRGSKKLKSGGIGKGWFEKYSSDVYPSDFIIMEGKKMKPPKYYDRCLEEEAPEEYRKIRWSRITNAKLHAADNTSSRHRVRETVQEARLKRLPRSLEGEI